MKMKKSIIGWLIIILGILIIYVCSLYANQPIPPKPKTPLQKKEYIESTKYIYEIKVIDFDNKICLVIEEVWVNGKLEKRSFKYVILEDIPLLKDFQEGI